MLFEAGLSFWSGEATRYPSDSGYDTGIFVRTNIIVRNFFFTIFEATFQRYLIFDALHLIFSLYL